LSADTIAETDGGDRFRRQGYVARPQELKAPFRFNDYGTSELVPCYEVGDIA
jgi:hypothetical protein